MKLRVTIAATTTYAGCVEVATIPARCTPRIAPRSTIAAPRR